MKAPSEELVGHDHDGAVDATRPRTPSGVSPSQNTVVLRGRDLTVEHVDRVARRGATVTLLDTVETRTLVNRSVAAVTAATERGDVIYGVTTGFGGMADRAIAPAEAASLQQNLLAFLDAGAGDLLDRRDVRAAMVIRANGHLRGLSGIRWDLVERFTSLLNADVVPEVRQLGSIGASGDLLPLAAIARALTGTGNQWVRRGGERVQARRALVDLGLEPIPLRAKEGLALVNGTAVSTAIGVGCAIDAHTYLDVALAVHALAVQALEADTDAFDHFVHAAKPHHGQRRVAQRVRTLLAGSGLVGTLGARHRLGNGELVQDRYSLRCLPQFLGPVLDTIRRVTGELEVEMNSVSDNPLVDGATGQWYHGGNFLAQYVATGLDSLRAQLALACKHLDVQVAMLMSPMFSRGLPASLVGNTDRAVNMGLKGLQICGNSIMPLVMHRAGSLADRFPTHAEEHNQNVNSQSLGSALLTRQQLGLMQQHLAIALIAAVQAVDLRAAARFGTYDPRRWLSPGTRPLYQVAKDLLEVRPSAKQALIHNDVDRSLTDAIDILAGDLRDNDALHCAAVPAEADVIS